MAIVRQHQGTDRQDLMAVTGPRCGQAARRQSELGGFAGRGGVPSWLLRCSLVCKGRLALADRPVPFSYVGSPTQPWHMSKSASTVTRRSPGLLLDVIAAEDLNTGGNRGVRSEGPRLLRPQGPHRGLRRPRCPYRAG